MIMNRCKIHEFQTMVWLALEQWLVQSAACIPGQQELTCTDDFCLCCRFGLLLLAWLTLSAQRLAGEGL